MPSLAQFLKKVEDVCIVKKPDPFTAVMSMAQDRQAWFTAEEAIKAGCETIRIVSMFAPGIGSTSARGYSAKNG